MKPALTALPVALTAALLIAGCGSSGDETTNAPEPLKRSGTSGAPIGASVKKCPVAIALTGRLGDSIGGLRVSGASCKTGAAVMSSWLVRRCIPAKGESRSACTVRHFRCLTVRVDRGVAINCARRGRSISFVLNR